MKIVNKIKNMFTPKNQVQMQEWIDLAKFLGLDAKDGDNSEATYFACLKIISESVGKLPLKLLQTTKKDGVVEAKKHVLYDVVRYRPNAIMNSSIFWNAVEQNRLHYGNAYVLIKGYGKNIELILLESEKVEIIYDDAKIISDKCDIWYRYRGKEEILFSNDEILHFKGSNTKDGIAGLSVRETLKSVIEGNKKSQKLINNLYDCGFTAKAVVQYTGNLNDDLTKTFIKNIGKYAKGEIDGAKGIIPIPLGATLTPLTTKLGDNEFLEIKKYTALQIAAAFGIKPVQINDYSKSSYASSEAQNLAFLVDTLLFILKQYEEELNYKLLSVEERKKGYHFKFNISMLLRADLKTQIDTLSTGVANGIYTPNEARAFLDLENKDGCDFLMCNGSNIKVKDIGIQYAPEEIVKGGDTSEKE